jgi:hypothetical protein
MTGISADKRVCPAPLDKVAPLRLARTILIGRNIPGYLLGLEQVGTGGRMRKHNTPMLKDGATAYKVDTDAITAEVKHECAAKEKERFGAARR